ncbi:MAG: hypothetical protein AB201_03490 [Parcubacteria bacterium C7867-006]|nr:MAG: hypothetical protein AB201_03490 [Parcubacteria bacterium C7867-006]
MGKVQAMRPVFRETHNEDSEGSVHHGSGNSGHDGGAPRWL